MEIIPSTRVTSWKQERQLIVPSLVLILSHIPLSYLFHHSGIHLVCVTDIRSEILCRIRDKAKTLSHVPSQTSYSDVCSTDNAERWEDLHKHAYTKQFIVASEREGNDTKVFTELLVSPYHTDSLHPILLIPPFIYTPIPTLITITHHHTPITLLCFTAIMSIANTHIENLPSISIQLPIISTYNRHIDPIVVTIHSQRRHSRVLMTLSSINISNPCQLHLIPSPYHQCPPSTLPSILLFPSISRRLSFSSFPSI